MAKRAITITIYAMVPLDDYDGREGDLLDGIESGLQAAGADYTDPVITPGIPADVSDIL